LGGTNRGDVAARARPDDNDIKFVHVLSDARSPPGRLSLS